MRLMQMIAQTSGLYRWKVWGCNTAIRDYMDMIQKCDIFINYIRSADQKEQGIYAAQELFFSVGPAQGIDYIE